VLAVTIAALVVVATVAAATNTPSARQQQAASNYIERAVLPAINGPACAREHVAANITGPPPASLLSILGVLRGPPAAPVDRAALPILSHMVGVYINYVRLARTAFGLNWYLFVADGNQGFLPPANVSRCLQRQSSNLRRELPTIPKSLVALTQRMFNAQLAAERRRDGEPLDPSVWLSTLGGGGGGGTASDIELGRFVGTGGPGIPGNPQSATVRMVVPDGVANATISYSAGPANGFKPKVISPPVTISAGVVGNVLVFNVPRSSGGGQITQPTSMIWRNASGAVIRRFHGRL
jgi:hypothetical protein